MGTQWAIHGREFSSCNCSYGCPCQFNALPTHGHCWAVMGAEIESGYHADTRLDGLRFASIFRYPGAIHLGDGEALAVVDGRASAAQRRAILRILEGEDTRPGATIFQALAATVARRHEPVFADIDFHVDIDKRRAHLRVAGYIEQRGEPIVNPVTGAEHRVRIEIEGGFEYRKAEIGRGWATTQGPIAFELSDSYGQFNALDLCQDGIP